MVTILEREASKAVRAQSRKLHCGLCQRDVAAEGMLISTLTNYEVVIHHFDTISALYEQNQRSYIDLIVFASGGDPEWLNPLIREIKVHSILQFIPILVLAPTASKNYIMNAYKLGIEEIVTEAWDHQIEAAKIEMLIFRSRRDISVNPSTKLPGPSAIEYEIDKRLHTGEKFAVCYGDLDNFKAYNDYYGYIYGDKMIRITSLIIRNVVQDLTAQGFVGHIGGDDFIWIVPPELVDAVCKNIIATFDRMSPFRYAEADRERGWIEVPNRRGVIERFPIVTISIGVIINQKRMFKHPGEMSHMMADLKKYTKSLPGSNYMIERRKKY
jgi:diguanylate cyclase (GGDEF)-like protein